MKNKLLLLSLLILAGALPGRAQLTEADTLRFGYRLGVSGSQLTGNVDRFLVLGNADFSTVRDGWAFRTTNTYQYGTFGRFNTENDLFSKNFFYLAPRRRFYPYFMAWVETNLRRNFSLRYQVGPGVTYGVSSGKDHLLKVSATLTFEETAFNDSTFVEQTYDGRDRIGTTRGTVRVFGRHALFQHKLRIRYELWGQQSLRYGNNYRLHGDVFLEFPLSKLLAFRAGYNYNYESVVLTSVEQQDTFLVFGLTFGNLK